MKRFLQQGFTLAEVLITLAIVGIVAAMTIPTLVKTINNKVNNNKIKIIQTKISQGVEAVQVRGVLAQGFFSTMDFVDELEQDMKIIKKCDKDNLRSCWPYDKVSLDDYGSEIVVKDQKDGKIAFMKNEGEWGETTGIVLGNGVPVLLSYKKNCIIDPDSRYEMSKDGISQAAQCMAGIYDINGKKGPNKFGIDVIGFNTSAFVKLGCSYKVPGTSFCFTGRPFMATGVLLKDYCDYDASNDVWTVKDSYKNLGVETCAIYGGSRFFNTPDNWVGAVETCGGTQNLPTESDLYKLSNYIHKPGQAGIDTDKVPKIFSDILNENITDSTSTWIVFWANREDGAEYLARNLTFTYQGCGGYRADRRSTGAYTICIRKD